MNSSHLITFQKLSAIALVLTALTTVVAHLISFPAASFEEKVLLYQNTGYVLRNNVIILHGILVMVSMLGLGLLAVRKSPGWIVLGFLAFSIFGMAEITRMITANVFINGLRETYHLTDDAGLKQQIEFVLQQLWPLFANQLFLIFILAFSIGCISYGIAFRTKGWTGWILIIWGCGNVVAFANEFIQLEALGSAIGIFSLVYQPLARLYLGVWLWREVERRRTEPQVG